MDINVSTSMGFSNQEFNHRESAFLSKKTEKNSDAKDIELFNKAEYNKYNFNGSILNIPAEITINNSLKETLKYLRMRKRKDDKKHILGEIWDEFIKQDNTISENNELIDFEVDFSLNNIFTAA